MNKLLHLIEKEGALEEAIMKLKDHSGNMLIHMITDIKAFRVLERYIAKVRGGDEVYFLRNKFLEYFIETSIKKGYTKM